MKARILLDEIDFKLLVSQMFINHNHKGSQIVKLEFTIEDIYELVEGNIVATQFDGIDFEVALCDIGYDRIFYIMRDGFK